MALVCVLGKKLSGTFHADGENQFWNVSGFENTVVIELNDEHFSRLVVSLDNPVEQAARITERATAR
ncbi:hypothetical protein SFC07_13190 [Corynebacterium callunae]|uniref:hypothetical protein n=1 Tax=Corynebacterium callunae TaxID=1721 RepID=UPI003982497B